MLLAPLHRSVSLASHISSIPSLTERKSFFARTRSPIRYGQINASTIKCVPASINITTRNARKCRSCTRARSWISKNSSIRNRIRYIQHSPVYCHHPQSPQKSPRSLCCSLWACYLHGIADSLPGFLVEDSASLIEALRSYFPVLT